MNDGLPPCPSMPLIQLGIGELVVCSSPAVISTVLGSCISVCLFATNGRGGGMNHFVLPEPQGQEREDEQVYRYGTAAILGLIEHAKTRLQVRTSDLKAKIAGGAQIGNLFHKDIGERNIALARHLLDEQGIEIVGEAIGGAAGRSIFFYPCGGRLRASSVNLSGHTLGKLGS